MKLEEPHVKQSVLYALLAGALFSIFRYNFIGLSQFDTLPTIYRMADPGYLVNDLFTNSAAKYSEDIYFSRVILLLAKLAPIPIVFFILTLLSNMAVAVISFFTARHLFKGNNWIGIIAVVLVLTMDTMKLGYSGLVVRSDLIPSQLARPMVLAVIYFTLKRKYIWVGVIAAVATFIHPLEGPGVGLMVLVCSALVTFFSKEGRRKQYVAIMVSTLLVLLAILPFVIPYFNQEAGSMSDELFVEINIFRFAHHYAPSYFINIRELILGFSFLTAAGFGLTFWRGNYEVNAIRLFLIFFVAFLLAICLGGYLFVEIWPSRIWLIAQPWRFLIYLKWLGLLFIAGAIWLVLKQGAFRGVITWLSAVHPVLLLINLLSNKYLSRRINPWVQLAFLAAGVCSLRLLGLIRSDQVLLGFLAISATLLFVGYKRLYAAAWMTIALCTVIINAFNIDFQSYKARFIGVRSILSPDIFIEDNPQGYRGLAGALREYTPEDAVILCPAIMSELRLTANRALVVDFVGIPMEDEGMKEWYERIKEIHAPLKKDPKTIMDYDVKSIQLNDDELLEAKEAYGSEYAILQANKKTVFPVVYKDNKYQLVRVSASQH